MYHYFNSPSIGIYLIIDYYMIWKQLIVMKITLIVTKQRVSPFNIGCIINQVKNYWFNLNVTKENKVACFQKW